MKFSAPRFFSPSLWKLLCLLAVLPALASAAEVQVWLLLNTAASETLMSTDVLEKNKLIRSGWKVSGSGLLQSESDTATGEIFRMVKMDPQGALRMLAVTPAAEKTQLKAGYVTEGMLGYVATKSGPGHVPVFRYSKDDHYLWVMSQADQNWATKNGWTRDKAMFWLWTDAER